MATSNIVSSDPIADMLTRIRNAIAVRKGEISLPHSKVKESIARMLKAQNFIDDVRVEGAALKKTLIIRINGEFENARITSIKAISTPGRRIYANAQEIPVVKHGRGIVIVSTSQGLMSGMQAKKAGVGGEIMCEVY